MVACGSTESAKAPYKLNGAGATFPAPYYNAVLGSLHEATGNKVNYQAVGSGAGVRQFTAKTVDFGARWCCVMPSNLPKVWFTSP